MARQLISFDWAMKRLLRNKANFGILEGFLSELLKQDIKILSLLESESNKEDRNGKLNRVDLLAELTTGEIVLIEVQVNSESDYFCRMLYGVSKIIVEHLKEKQKEVFKKEKVHEIYPEYYLIKVNQFNEIAKDTLDQWIYFLKTEEIKDSFHAKGLIEAKEKLDSLKLNPQEKEEYKKYVENLTYQKSMVISNYEDGRVTGRHEGKVEGKIEVAKKLKAMGMDNKNIQQATGLSVDEIDKIF